MLSLNNLEELEPLFPHPCTKCNLDFVAQLEKVHEELAEFEEAIERNSDSAMLEEGTDLIVAVTTLLAKKFSLGERMNAMLDVNQKNKSRGYY